MLPLRIVPLLENALTSLTGSSTHIASSSILSGSSTRQAVKLTYANTHFVVKWHQSPLLNGMFEVEAKGLQQIANTKTILTPKCFHCRQKDDFQFLLMEYIDSASPTQAFWESLGKNLAQLHKNSSEWFGLENDNFIGDLPQKNTPSPSWSQFFVNERLAPMLQRIVDNKLIDNDMQSDFFDLFDKIDGLFPHEAPALLHGDLWNGNIICNTHQQAVLIDPAVYFGHREMDIAMTLLFGGFQPAFYTAYQSHFPLAEGWQQRTTLWNLYPLMVHVNLFGKSYLPQLVHHLHQLK